MVSGVRARRVGAGGANYVAGLPDGSGRVVVVLRGGIIRVMNPTTGTFEANDLLNIASQIDTNGEKGLLSIAFSPNFVSDRTFYLHLNPNSASATEIRKYRVMSDNYARADTTTADAILTIPQPSATNTKAGHWSLIFRVGC
jgi:glucose/arabinose dehydrogenase